MNNPKISIIMPVYNTGEILHTTIRCILNQTYKNFELLLIDDGSKDGSGKVCDDYAAMDSTSSPTGKSRIKVFHKPNGGICDARNYGLDRATGDYIAFCDHDDEYLPELLEKCTNLLEQYDVNVIKYMYKTIDDNESNESYLMNWSKKDFDIVDVAEEVIRLLSKDYLSTVWSFIYKKSFLDNCGLKFDTKFKHGGEDVDFNTRLLPYMGKLIVLNDCLYVHYVRGSLSTSAKLYDDVPEYFFDQVNQANSILQQMEVKMSSDCSNYIYYYTEHLIGFLSYACKMREPYTYIKEKFVTYKQYNLLEGKRVCLSGIPIKHRFVYTLYQAKFYWLLYLLAKAKH